MNTENNKKMIRSTPQWIKEFQAFIMRGNVIDLAVGIIVGAAFTSVVNSLVKDIFNPLIGLLIGGIDFSNLFFTLKGQHVQTLEEAQRLGVVTLNIGVFLNTIIQFLIVGFAVFWMVKLLNELYKNFKLQEDNKAGSVAPTKQELLLEEIRDALVTKNKS